MLFNSLQFVVFLPIVLCVYWIAPHRFRWILLFAASYYFYMSWSARYVVLILFTTVVSYTAGVVLERYTDVRIRRLTLFCTLAACLGVLFVFKYFNFFSESLSALAGALAIPMHPVTLQLLLPVGISFYTFQTLGYVIDVYRGDVQAEHHFGIYATFISFFPQLVAGPIERTRNLLPQIGAEHRFDDEQALFGAKLMLWGYFKKLVIADNLAVFVDRIFDDVFANSGFAFVLAVFFFTIQIYCDFSGYSDIARGVAKLMGIELMENFKSPYFAQGLHAFWSRWHISLSTWFRDYLYIPLGGNRRGEIRRRINLVITFLASGLWHGANWTFVLWGALHGAGQVAENLVFGKREEARTKTGSFFRVLLTFLFVTFAWTFFRAQNMAEITHIFTHVFDGVASPVHYLWKGFADINMRKEILFGYCALFFLPLCLFDYASSKAGVSGIELLDRAGERHKILLWAFWVWIGLLIVFFAPKGVPEDFVYFQF